MNMSVKKGTGFAANVETQQMRSFTMQTNMLQFRIISFANIKTIYVLLGFLSLYCLSLIVGVERTSSMPDPHLGFQNWALTTILPIIVAVIAFLVKKSIDQNDKRLDMLTSSLERMSAENVKMQRESSEGIIKLVVSLDSLKEQLKSTNEQLQSTKSRLYAVENRHPR